MAPQTTFYDALALRTSKIVTIIDLLTLAQHREVPIEDLSAAKNHFDSSVLYWNEIKIHQGIPHSPAIINLQWPGQKGSGVEEFIHGCVY